MNKHVLNLNGNQDAQPVRGYQVLNNTPGNRAKAIESCVYDSMTMMASGEYHANAVISNGADKRR